MMESSKDNQSTYSVQEEIFSNNMFASVWVKVENTDDNSSEEEMELTESREQTHEESSTENDEQTKKIRQKGQTVFCALCNFSTPYKSSLINHMFRHNTANKYACEKCDYTTKYRASLQRHKHLKHNERKEIVKKPTHPLDHFKCDECDFVAKTKPNLKAHKRKHVDVKQFKCMQCPYETAYRHNFLKHNRQHSKILYKCNKCPFMTKYEGHIYRHMTQIHKGLIEKGHNCKFCDFSTMVGWRLNVHVQRSKQPDVLKCNYCDFETMYKCESKRHKKTHNSETKKPNSKEDALENISLNLEFDLDGRTPEVPVKYIEPRNTGDDHKTSNYTVDPNYLERNNIQVLESDDKEHPFKCHVCDYSSRFKAAVQRHFRRRHTDQQTRPFKCMNCDFSTKTKDQITLHIKRSESINKLRCNYCDFATTFKCQLIMHKKIHYKYKCTECDYSYKNKYDLDKHFSIQHLGIFVQCKYCDYRAAQKDILASHEATHTGDRPLKCSQCDYKTVKDSLLLKHMNKRHYSLERTGEVTDLKSLQVTIDN